MEFGEGTFCFLESIWLANILSPRDFAALLFPHMGNYHCEAKFQSYGSISILSCSYTIYSLAPSNDWASTSLLSGSAAFVPKSLCSFLKDTPQRVVDSPMRHKDLTAFLDVSNKPTMEQAITISGHRRAGHIATSGKNGLKSISFLQALGIQKISSLDRSIAYDARPKQLKTKTAMYTARRFSIVWSMLADCRCKFCFGPFACLSFLDVQKRGS